ncbi:TRAFs-binding domain-containing protein [Anaerotignum sp.]|uniref:TRAFs-binding domain-containing protein n=1 Tax=Anaerotignum sp. TaxID=2039241 RepID=UPI002A837C22|nr:TRAFs-binding domain-containing protein [Anaerotignum sp.]MDY3596975.1 TRAFs-binding domain-containing protein [Anaerotignum sp.]
MKKTCFVVMGFGKKMDYRNSKEIDLDLIYKQVIKQLFDSDFKDYQLIRADEISGSEIIDISMYALLIKSDLVIADITTSNENALYELGIRHALKPFSTIIMMQKSDKGSIPFDLSHNRILAYDDYGEYLDENEADDIRKSLKEFVLASQENKTDSPFYTYLPNVIPPSLEDKDYKEILEKALNKEKTISKFIEEANSLKKQNKFEASICIWNKLHEIIPNNNYVTQQLAFAIYKAKKPNETLALQKALEVIMTLKPNTSLDLETLGITGAIYKRLYKVNNNFDYLDEAIKMYQRGYTIRNDYYTGENYANCLLLKTKKEGISIEEINYLQFSSKKTYSEIIDLLLAELKNGEIDYWMYATLSTSYYVTGDNEKHKEYEKLFLTHLSADWEKETYFENLELIKSCLQTK